MLFPGTDRRSRSLRRTYLSFSVTGVIHFFRVGECFFQGGLTGIPTGIPGFYGHFGCCSPMSSLRYVIIFDAAYLSSVSKLLVFSVADSTTFLPVSSDKNSVMMVYKRAVMSDSIPRGPTAGVSSNAHLPGTQDQFYTPVTGMSMGTGATSGSALLCVEQSVTSTPSLGIVPIFAVDRKSGE